jgi:hypothetical protein
MLQTIYGSENDFNAMDRDGNTPLHRTCPMGDDRACLAFCACAVCFRSCYTFCIRYFPIIFFLPHACAFEVKNLLFFLALIVEWIFILCLFPFLLVFFPFIILWVLVTWFVKIIPTTHQEKKTPTPTTKERFVHSHINFYPCRYEPRRMQ